jgi:SAM-dependent methyltransferase
VSPSHPKGGYDAGFYDAVNEAARYAASEAVPHILEFVRPGSVLDVGCGAGAWLAEFARRGVSDYQGIDGDWLDLGRLTIPSDRFTRADLTSAFDLGRRFDLVLSLEVAEHLPPAAADGFVASLVRHADVVAFSAAVPYQGGTNHMNEQWQPYWAERFARHGYVGCECLRRRLWHLSRFNTWFYAQNLIVYVREAVLPQLPELAAAYRAQGGPPLPVAHPGLVELWLPWEKHLTLRGFLRLLPRLIARSVAHRWSNWRGPKVHR